MDRQFGFLCLAFLVFLTIIVVSFVRLPGRIGVKRKVFIAYIFLLLFFPYALSRIQSEARWLTLEAIEYRLFKKDFAMEVLWADVADDGKERIHFLLKDQNGEPRLFWEHWDPDLAQGADNAMKEGAASGQNPILEFYFSDKNSQAWVPYPKIPRFRVPPPHKFPQKPETLHKQQDFM